MIKAEDVIDVTFQGGNATVRYFRYPVSQDRGMRVRDDGVQDNSMGIRTVVGAKFDLNSILERTNARGY